MPKTASLSTRPSPFAARLKAARLAAGLSQMQLGVNAGFDELSAGARISQYESGIHVPLSPIARHIAIALNVPLAYLYCDEDELAHALIVLYRAKPAARTAMLKAFR